MWANSEPTLSPAEAIDALVVKPLRERTSQILTGELEPVLDDIRVIDRSKSPEISKLEIIATKPLYFVAPSGTATSVTISQNASVRQGSNPSRSWRSPNGRR